jgi:glycine cleavage system regulatory protein
VASAPWSAEELFHAVILAGLPPAMNPEELQSALEGLSDDLTVEISDAETMA